MPNCALTSCDEEFEDNFGKRRGRPRLYCSPRCAKAAGRDRSTVCDRDGCERMSRARGLCVTHYNQAFGTSSRQSRNGDPAKRRAALRTRTQRRRALIRDPLAEKVDRDVVGERDGWRCGICAGDVDRALSHPDPWSPSLDHVVPLSLGGRHTYENVRLTHFRCNVKRGNRVDQVVA